MHKLFKPPSFKPPSFKPPLWMRPAMVQTVMASMQFLKCGTNAMDLAAREMILDCGFDEGGPNIAPKPARLMGAYSPAPDSKAMVVFLHGWEGSQDSAYVVSAARQLFDRGCSVFRLNFRDHGPTHHLNEDIFLGTRFAEVYSAVQQICALEPQRKIYIAGFSMGGNFVLRIARENAKTPIKNLTHIFSISPVIDPVAAAPLVDKGLLVSRHFIKKLKRSMRLKQAAFPGMHDFSKALKMKTVMGISEALVPKYSGLDNLDDYFNGYRIWPDDLAKCEVAVSIIMAKDDPIVPPDDVDTLNLSAACRDIRLDYGGHNGFFQTIRGPRWYEDYMRDVIFDESAEG